MENADGESLMPNAVPLVNTVAIRNGLQAARGFTLQRHFSQLSRVFSCFLTMLIVNTDWHQHVKNARL